MKQCMQCKKIIRGRIDKKYCSKDCSNKYHSNNRKQLHDSTVSTINRILLNNRNVLIQLFENEKSNKLKLPKIVLTKLGFNFEYITGYYTNRQGKVYHYVYDYAWMKFSSQEVLLVRK